LFRSVPEYFCAAKIESTESFKAEEITFRVPQQSKQMEDNQSQNEYMSASDDVEVTQIVQYHENQSDDKLNCLEMKKNIVAKCEANDNALLSFSSHSNIDLKGVEWMECETMPTQFMAEKDTCKKVLYAEHQYNHHETNKSTTIFRCKYRRKGCKAELKFFNKENKWYYKLGHIHPTPSQISKIKTNKPRIIDLLPSRKECLKNAVLRYKRTRASSDMCAILNEGVNPSDFKVFIFPEQVIEAKQKWIYTQEIKSFEDVCNRSDLRSNRRGETYVRVYRNLPIFIFQFCSDWQVNILRQL
jgi:hypothetical protein